MVVESPERAIGAFRGTVSLLLTTGVIKRAEFSGGAVSAGRASLEKRRFIVLESTFVGTLVKTRFACLAGTLRSTATGRIVFARPTALALLTCSCV